MTKCEELGYKVGDEFIVNETGAPFDFIKGEVVVLIHDDGGSCPRFKSKVNHNEEWAYLHDVKKIEQPQYWNGEGLPPVGVECEFSGVGDDEWKRCIVYGIYDDRYFACAWGESLNENDSFLIESFEFRKPETPEQKAEREVVENLRDAIQRCEELGLPVYHGDEMIAGATIVDNCVELS